MREQKCLNQTLEDFWHESDAFVYQIGLVLSVIWMVVCVGQRCEFTTMSLPLFSGFLASMSAATVLAPDEIPTYPTKLVF